MKRWGLAFMALLMTMPGGVAQNRTSEESQREAIQFFETEIRPLLHRNCLTCHSREKRTSGLSLESRREILQGGIRGPAAQPGTPDQSRLIQAVEHRGELKMPRDGDPLEAREVAALRRWVELGLPWPTDQESPTSTPIRSRHWAFQPIRKLSLPSVRNAAWVRNPIDHFVLARLESEGLQPSPMADRITLIRRLTLDLLGLPPSPEEVDAFMADRSLDAYERLVDRLLDSPHYGERWGRHWLDVARYADTNGFGFDRPRVMWRYRDWVIQAFNRDMPFDRFVIEQLAGDLLPKATLEQKIATGFHRNTMINEEGGVDQEQYRVEAAFDRVATTGAAFLGLTVGCAQCHDHKYDPISQRDFYRLFAFFNSQEEPTIEVVQPEDVERFRRASADFKLKKLRLEAQVAEREAQLADAIAAWEAQLTLLKKKKLPPNVQAILGLPQGKRTLSQVRDLEGFYKDQDRIFQERRRALKAFVETPNDLNPKQFTAMVLQEQEEPRKTHVLIGGDFLRPGVEVLPGTPSVLPPLRAKGGATRLDLARWLVSKENPLTARVTVNRIWQRYFGRGLVTSAENFGTQGELPSHPELLDWLSNEFMNRGWSVKSFHRLIATSATYRQSSRLTPQLKAEDPENRLLARFPRTRVEGEIVRDIALTVGGLIHHKIGGPSVFPPQPPGITDLSRGNLIWVTDGGRKRYRRSMYTFWKRTSPYPSLMIFDQPTADESIVRRDLTNTPLQSLVTLNDVLFVEAAQGLALRALRHMADDDARLEYAFRLCVARKPDPREKRMLSTFLGRELERFRTDSTKVRKLLPENAPSDVPPAEFVAWFSLARVLLNLDETITRE